MFTGLVEEVGDFVRLQRDPAGTCLTLAAPKVSQGTSIGDSISVNGACLTVSSKHAERLDFQLLEETLLRTNLGDLQQGSKVNLERALAANARLGGHFVQGHVDGTVSLLNRRETNGNLKLEFALPGEFSRYLVSKGSICVNGVSLTVAELTETRFGIWIIPHTRRETNLGDLAEGNKVNIEVDLLAKYVERILLAGR
jgi:riboflavin synthase